MALVDLRVGAPRHVFGLSLIALSDIQPSGCDRLLAREGLALADWDEAVGIVFLEHWGLFSSCTFHSLWLKLFLMNR